MSKSLAQSTILKRIAKRKKADAAMSGPEWKVSLKTLPPKRSVLKLSADGSRGLIKRRTASQGDKAIRNKGKRALERLDESY